MRVSINGFGRIGRQVLRRVALAEPGIEVAAVNSIRAEPALCREREGYEPHGG